MADHMEPNWRSFAPITSYDKAGYIWIAMLYGMTVSILILAIRTWYKQSAFGKDDSLFVAASVAMMAHVICLIIALKKGLGTSISLSSDESGLDKEEGAVGISAMTAYMFFLVALALAKSSTIMFIQRILSRDLKKLYMACYASVVVFALWAIGSMSAVGAGCDASTFMSEDMNSACGDQGLKWTAIAAVDAVSEAILMVVPIFIIWPLQISFYMKVQVFLAFAFRLGVAALAISHAIYINRVASSATPEITCVPAIVLAECELCWSLISATIPNLKAFMKTFNTGFGLNDLKNAITSTAIDNSNSGTRRDRENNFEMQRMSTVRETSRMRGDGIHGQDLDSYKVEVMRGQSSDDQGSLASGHSQELIIHKTVNHEVTYENKKRSIKGVFT